jgi:hypothetical protein
MRSLPCRLSVGPPASHGDRVHSYHESCSYRCAELRSCKLVATDDTTRRRHALLVDVTQAASEVSRLVHEASDLNLPVEPGVRDGRNALVRWAVLLEEVLP